VIVKYLLKVAMLGSSWVMYVLLALSVASIGAMVERWWFFRKYGRGGEDLGEALCDLLERGDRRAAEGLLRRHPAIEAEVYLKSLRWAQGGADALAAAIDGELTRLRRDLERGMTLLGTLGNNAPFIGLFGTVIGVIVAFADLAEGTNKVAMDKVMGGIAEALVATGVGLFVAIPAVVAYNLFQKKITDIEDNVSSTAKRLCALLAAVGSFEDLALPESDFDEPLPAKGSPDGEVDAVRDAVEPEPTSDPAASETPLLPRVEPVDAPLRGSQEPPPEPSAEKSPECGAEE
jgi:biopolymer transport protein ExbB/biopolymer transport protein TolQ